MNNKYVKYIFAMVLLVLLALIRLFEFEWFNDGLILFFQHDYLTEKLPWVPFDAIILTDSIRYWLNALISIMILNLFFWQKDLNKFLALIYTVAFLVLIILFIYFIKHYEAGNYLGLFYVRRFLIQPLLLFILLPALWYQHNKTKKCRLIN